MHRLILTAVAKIVTRVLQAAKICLAHLLLRRRGALVYTTLNHVKAGVCGRVLLLSPSCTLSFARCFARNGWLHRALLSVDPPRSIDWHYHRSGWRCFSRPAAGEQSLATRALYSPRTRLRVAARPRHHLAATGLPLLCPVLTGRPSCSLGAATWSTSVFPDRPRQALVQALFGGSACRGCPCSTPRGGGLGRRPT